MIVFVDGVRRVDARVWVEPDAADAPTAGAAAHARRCVDRLASAEPAWRRRGPPARCACASRSEPGGARTPSRSGGGCSRRAPRRPTSSPRHGTYGDGRPAPGAPEVAVAGAAGGHGPAEIAVAGLAAQGAARRAEPPALRPLLVLDGPLRGRQHLPGAVGMIKTHHTAYLPGAASAVLLGRLAPGERTPVFTHRLVVDAPLLVPAAARAGGGGPLAGVVRCECPADVGAEAPSGSPT